MDYYTSGLTAINAGTGHLKIWNRAGRIRMDWTFRMKCINPQECGPFLFILYVLVKI
jgi:hypothetical protein